MKQSKKIFLEATDATPRFYYDLILLEYRYPLLFTCMDDNDQMYLVTCFAADSKKRVWLIVQTSPSEVIEML